MTEFKVTQAIFGDSPPSLDFAETKYKFPDSGQSIGYSSIRVLLDNLVPCGPLSMPWPGNRSYNCRYQCFYLRKAGVATRSSIIESWCDSGCVDQQQALVWWNHPQQLFGFMFKWGNLFSWFRECDLNFELSILNGRCLISRICWHVAGGYTFTFLSYMQISKPFDKSWLMSFARSIPKLNIIISCRSKIFWSTNND